MKGLAKKTTKTNTTSHLIQNMLDAMIYGYQMKVAWLLITIQK